MKQIIKRSFLLSLCIFTLLLSACGQQQSPAQNLPEQPAPGEPLRTDEQDDSSLESRLKNAGIACQWRDGQLCLTECGIEACLRPETPYLYRRDFIVAVLPSAFLVQDEKGCLPETAWEAVFSDGTFLNDILFFRDEVSDALKNPDSEAGRAILPEVELPCSMGIETPNLNSKRIFEEKRLDEYPAALAAELEEMGFENAGSYTYSEYVTLTEARTVEEANLSQFFLRNEALAKEDPAQWTVRAYHVWETQNRLAETAAALTDEQRAFLEEKDIRLEDLFWLEKVFYDSYPQRTDEELREVIESYYRIALSRVTGE